jgi:hypothetical protein
LQSKLRAERPVGVCRWTNAWPVQALAQSGRGVGRLAEQGLPPVGAPIGASPLLPYRTLAFDYVFADGDFYCDAKTLLLIEIKGACPVSIKKRASCRAVEKCLAQNHLSAIAVAGFLSLALPVASAQQSSSTAHYWPSGDARLCTDAPVKHAQWCAICDRFRIDDGQCR